MSNIITGTAPAACAKPRTVEKDVVIIGGGPAGLAAACSLKKAGVDDIVILEREKQLGGILKQCIHDGFGLTRFGESLSGPEYADRFISEVHRLEIPYLTNTSVIKLTRDRTVTAAAPDGLTEYKAKAVILAMGCRERPRGAMSIAGSRPSGVFTAGVAQSYINLHNKMIGKDVVILGSGDIGMIMARRLTLEGASVKAVFEKLPYPSGLPRNIEQCLNDYGIPLYLSRTVTRIIGKGRIEAVEVSDIDPITLEAVRGTEQIIPCDTLILSCGLIPENELSEMAGVTLDGRTHGAVTDEYGETDVDGIFAAGNVLHVHDLVDFVSLEAERLASGVIRRLSEKRSGFGHITVDTDPSVRYTVPQRISLDNAMSDKGAGSALRAPAENREKIKTVTLSFRPSHPMKDCRFDAISDGRIIASLSVKRALPSVMLHMELPVRELYGLSEIKVVSSCE